MQSQRELTMILEDDATEYDNYGSIDVCRPLSKNISIPGAIVSIVKEGWPFVLSRLFTMGDNFVTVLVLSNYSKEYLNASPLIISGQLFTASSVVGVVYSTAIVAGKRLGANKIETIGGALHGGLILSVVLSVPVILVSLFAKNIYTLIGEDPQLAEISQQYFDTFIFGVPGFLAYTTCQQLLIGIGWPKIVLVSTMINTALTGGLGYLLVNGFSALPKFKMHGMGAAYSLGNWISFAGLLGFIVFNPAFRKYRVLHFPKLKTLVKNISELLKLGLPIGFQVLAELLTLLSITVFSGWVGKEELVANILAEQYLSIVIVLVFGYAQTIGTLVSREFGAKNYRNAKIIGNVGLALGVCASLCIATIFSTAAYPLSFVVKGRYKINHSLKTTIQNIFRVNGVGEVGDYARNISIGALRGLYYTKIPMVSSITTMTVLAIPLAYLLGFIAELDMVGIYLGRATGMILGGILMLSMWLLVSNISALHRQKKPDIPAITTDQTENTSISFFAKCKSLLFFSKKSSTENTSTLKINNNF